MKTIEHTINIPGPAASGEGALMTAITQPEAVVAIEGDGVELRMARRERSFLGELTTP